MDKGEIGVVVKPGAGSEAVSFILTMMMGRAMERFPEPVFQAREIEDGAVEYSWRNRD